MIKPLLECSDQTESKGNRTRINVVVNTAEYFGVETFVFGDDKRILTSTEES